MHIEFEMHVTGVNQSLKLAESALLQKMNPNIDNVNNEYF